MLLLVTHQLSFWQKDQLMCSELNYRLKSQTILSLKFIQRHMKRDQHYSVREKIVLPKPAAIDGNRALLSWKCCNLDIFFHTIKNDIKETWSIKKALWS